jgi:hypothetical protein
MAQTLGDLVTAALMNDFDRTTTGCGEAGDPGWRGGYREHDHGAYRRCGRDVDVHERVELGALPSTMRRIDSVTDSDGWTI